MRAPLALWPRGLQWLPGFVASVPVALLLWSLRGADDATRTGVAATAILLGLPWSVPAMVPAAVLSVPVYMWLHTRGAAPAVLDWLGAMVLVGAVIGVHINTALGWRWIRREKSVPEPGIGDFLKRRADRARQRTDDAR